ncbi:MAG: hypothetical protein ACI84O_001355, partial [Myxococcota bacterium]
MLRLDRGCLGVEGAWLVCCVPLLGVLYLILITYNQSRMTSEQPSDHSKHKK